MLRRVWRDSRIAAARSLSREPTSTTSAESMAISEPDPMATPVSAAVSAGASLIPSPAIAVLPYCLSFVMISLLPEGRTLA